MVRALPCLLLSAALCTSAAPALADGEITIETLRHDEAQKAMQAGDLARARHLYQIILVTNPDDPRAHREVGRTSHALGELHFAASELRKADRLAGGARDPELHYLLAEALYATGRAEEARREYARAARELGPAPAERMEKLWLARIYARQEKYAEADAIYDAMLEQNPEDDEVLFAKIETRIFAEDWGEAERQLRDLLDRRPAHPHARETLAWVLEAQGKAGEESRLRSRLSEESGGPSFAQVFDHARSLERAGELEAALDRYREAYELDEHGDRELVPAIDRLRFRLTMEATAGMVVRDDPSGSVTEWRAGVAVPFADNHQLALRVSYDNASPAMTLAEATTATTTASVLLGRNRPLTTALMVSGNYRSVEALGVPRREDLSLGSAAEVRLGRTSRVQLHTRADFHMPWREAANTIREGGIYDGLTTHLYARPFGDRLILDTGAWLRRMELENLMDAGDRPYGSQALAFGGIDWVAWVNPENSARGQILDEEMLWPTYSADAMVLSYRHYEAWTDPHFMDRLVIAERNRIDELSGTLRQIVFRGALALELRGGAGYDWAREVSLWRAGGGLLLSPSLRTRLSFSYDIASESATGFLGRRQAGWVTLHADL